MKCPHCNAEITPGMKYCEFCGSQITYDMQKEQEQINKRGCPRCGSTNITFAREKQGELRGTKGVAVIRETVGVCKDCGYTWNETSEAASIAAPQKKKNNFIWWILGWLFFFPAPVMVLIWRKKNTWDIKVKIAVTVVFWLLIFILGSSSGSNTVKSSSSIQDNNCSMATVCDTPQEFDDIVFNI